MADAGSDGGDLTPGQEEEGMGTALRNIDRDLTDEELVEVWETTTRGVSDGTLPTFSDKASLIQDVLRRLGR